MSFMNPADLSREALETTYKLIRLRLFKADARNDFITSALNQIMKAEKLREKEKFFKKMISVLSDPLNQMDANPIGADVIGMPVIVYDRCRFAVPVHGKIREVNPHDGSLKVTFDENNHGGDNVTKHNDVWFLFGQCKIIL